MILFANGCSWTWGGGLEPCFNTEEERLALCWPHHLKEKLGYSEVVNLGLGGGSNQRIIRTTLEWLQTRGPQELSETVAIIQLTESSRFEYYQPEIDEWARCKVDQCIQNTESESKAVQRTNHRLETFTEIEGTFSILTTIFALTKMFEIFGVKKYFFWSLHGVNFEFFNSLRTLNSIELVDLPNLQGGCGTWDYEIIGRLPSGHIDYHPSITGHKQIADIIFEKIQSRL